MEKENNLLKSSGFVSSSNNSVMLTGKALFIYRELINNISKMLDDDVQIYETSSTIDNSILKTSGYYDNFPQQIMLAQNKKVSDPLTPAVCFHIYGDLKNKKLAKQNFIALAKGNCFRAENGNYEFPFRLSSFRMLEIIVIGSKESVELKKEEIKKKILHFFSSKKIKGKFINATDAFFLGESEGAKILQKLKGLKQEYTVLLHAKAIAIASVNDHQQYFGKKFNIRLKDNSHAHSVCVAFGLERIVAAIILNEK